MKADRKQSTLKKEKLTQHPKPTLQVTLAVALIKGKTFDTILRQATELGVSRIQPLLTRWTQVQIKDAASKLEKWEQHLIEACKQSNNSWLPDLSDPKPLKDFINDQALQFAVVASLESDAGNWSELSLAQPTTLFIGPEGDFAPEEYELLKARGVQPVSLGPQVLRSETSVVSAITILMELIRSGTK